MASSQKVDAARLAALECHAQGRLDCGEAGRLAAELEALTGEHRLRALRMLALYWSGRQARH